MRLRLLALFLCLAASGRALAQDADAGAGSAPAPVKQHAAPKADVAAEKEEVMEYARGFFSALLLGDARQVAQSCGLPFMMEDRRLQTDDDVMQAWLKALRTKRTDLLTLYGIEVLTPAEMEQKYGKPPARLANFPWKRQGAYIAVANLSGHAAVAVFARGPNGDYVAFGYHD